LIICEQQIMKIVSYYYPLSSHIPIYLFIFFKYKRSKFTFPNFSDSESCFHTFKLLNERYISKYYRENYKITNSTKTKSTKTHIGNNRKKRNLLFKSGICFLAYSNFFVELNVQIIRKNKQLPKV
jgi:hypothetical protein